MYIFLKRVANKYLYLWSDVPLNGLHIPKFVPEIYYDFT